MTKKIIRGDQLYGEDVFWVLFDYEVTRSQRYPSPLTLIKIEMTPSADDPAINRAAATVFTAELSSHLRLADIPTGEGNSYHILLPTTDENGGRAVCERLLSVFRNRFNTSEGESITLSLNMGLASHPGGAALTVEQLLQGAEKALQRSRQEGPNTYAAFSDL